jgi:transcriptional regulator with XRE-family HTH domain
MAQTIGDRIKTARTLRGLSIRKAADLAGIAQSTWSRIEAGTRSADNRHVLASIAQALQCSTADLTGQPPTPTDRASARIAAAVHQTVQALLDTDLDLPGTVKAARPLAELTAEAATIQQYGLSCRYADAAGRLPALLRETHTYLRGPHRDEALRTLSAAARWSMVTLKCLGHPAEAWVAADRSHDAARALGDPVVLGVAAWSRGHAATSCGAYARAIAIAMTGIETLRDDHTLQALQVTGSLQLLAGWAQRGLGHIDESDALIADARRIALELGDPGDDPHGLIFGPTNVGLWLLSAAVEAGDAGKAVEISGDLSVAALPPSRQTALHLDLGRALADLGDIGRATRSLLAAERTGPERVHGSALARETVRGLVVQSRRGESAGLHGLAERLNVQGS